MRNVKSLQEALKKMDIAYDSCHEVMSLGALNGYKGELLAEFDVSVDSNLCFKDRQVYIQQHGDQYIYIENTVYTISGFERVIICIYRFITPESPVSTRVRFVPKATAAMKNATFALGPQEL